MESQYKSIISFETELESEINKLNEMKEKIERKKKRNRKYDVKKCRKFHKSCSKKKRKT